MTKAKFDNLYGCKESIVDSLKRATDIVLGSKLAVVCGYGDVGKGVVEALRGQGAVVVVTEIDPICALQASFSGVKLVKLEDVVSEADIFVTCTGNRTWRSKVMPCVCVCVCVCVFVCCFIL